MTTIELIKDIVLFGGNLPKERKEEVTNFLNKHETKQLNILGVRHRYFFVTYLGTMNSRKIEGQINITVNGFMSRIKLTEEIEKHNNYKMSDVVVMSYIEMTKYEYECWVSE